MTTDAPGNVPLSDLLGLAAFRPVAWVRKHPDGTLTDELLPDARIEACRTGGGAWEPLYTKVAAARALEHAKQVREHNAELLAERDALRHMVTWAYSKMHLRTFNSMDDAMELDRLKLYTEHGVVA